MHLVYRSWKSIASQFFCLLFTRRRTLYFVSRKQEFVKTVHTRPFSSPGQRNTFHEETSAFTQEGITWAYSVQVIQVRFPSHYSPIAHKWSSAARMWGRGQLDGFGFTPHKSKQVIFLMPRGLSGFYSTMKYSHVLIRVPFAVTTDIACTEGKTEASVNETKTTFQLELKWKVRNS